jgi:hypothetical protein
LLTFLAAGLLLFFAGAGFAFLVTGFAFAAGFVVFLEATALEAVFFTVIFAMDLSLS